MYTITDALQAHKLELLAKAFGVVASMGTDCHKFIERAYERSGYTQEFKGENTTIKHVEMNIGNHAHRIIVRIEFDCEGRRETGSLYMHIGDDLQLYGEY